MSRRRWRRLRNLVSRAVDAEFLHSAAESVGGQFENSRGALRACNDSARMGEDCFNMAPLRLLKRDQLRRQGFSGFERNGSISIRSAGKRQKIGSEPQH